MNHNADVNGVPMHNSHSHFYDYVTEFPELPIGPSLDEKHKDTMKKLRHQLISDNDWD